jgi:hypothetical protein
VAEVASGVVLVDGRRRAEEECVEDETEGEDEAERCWEVFGQYFDGRRGGKRGKTYLECPNGRLDRLHRA